MQQQTQRIAQKTILMIDNDEDFLATKREILEKKYNVLTATTTAEAREIIQDQHPDLVLLDVRLIDDNEPKDESGLGFSYYLRDLSLPYIILTAYTTPEIARQTLKSDDQHGSTAEDYLGKEENNEKLLKSIDKALKKAQTQRQKLEELPPESSAPDTKLISWVTYKEVIISTFSLFVALPTFLIFLFKNEYTALAISVFFTLVFIICLFILFLKDTSEDRELAKSKKVTIIATITILLAYFLFFAVYLFWQTYSSNIYIKNHNKSISFTVISRKKLGVGEDNDIVISVKNKRQNDVKVAIELSNQEDVELPVQFNEQSKTNFILKGGASESKTLTFDLPFFNKCIFTPCAQDGLVIYLSIIVDGPSQEVFKGFTHIPVCRVPFPKRVAIFLMSASALLGGILWQILRQSVLQ